MKNYLNDFFKYAIIYPNTYGDDYRKIISDNFNEKIKNSSVLVNFYIENYNNILLILIIRSKNLSLHAGEISFTGGKVEDQDKNFIDTALRETFEEIFLEKENIFVYGQLPEIFVPTGFNIYPILSTTDKIEPYNFNTNEVQKIILIPSSFILNEKNYQINKNIFKNIYFENISINYLKYNIWGVTANILYRLAKTYTNYLKII